MDRFRHGSDIGHFFLQIAVILGLAAPLSAQQGLPGDDGGLSAAAREGGVLIQQFDDKQKEKEKDAPAPVLTPLQRLGIEPAELSKEPPSVGVGEIIQKFSSKEAEFRKERERYQYTQTAEVDDVIKDEPDGPIVLRVGDMVRHYSVETDPSGNPYRWRQTSIIAFDEATDERIEKYDPNDTPKSTLRKLKLSPQDIDDLEHIQPFVLTPEDIGKKLEDKTNADPNRFVFENYVLTYMGRQKIGKKKNVDTYVFAVEPTKTDKEMMKGDKRYFLGYVWVEQQDLQIVKSHGKAVPDIIGGHQENLFPIFITIRQKIDGKYWFPVKTLAQDILPFSSPGRPLPIQEIVEWKDYKPWEFHVHVKSRVLVPTEGPNDKSQTAPKKDAPPQEKPQ